MVITTTSGKKIKIDPDEVVSIVTDNFSSTSKVKVDKPDGGHTTYTIAETALDFMERLNRA